MQCKCANRFVILNILFTEETVEQEVCSLLFIGSNRSVERGNRRSFFVVTILFVGGKRVSLFVHGFGRQEQGN